MTNTTPRHRLEKVLLKPGLVFSALIVAIGIVFFMHIKQFAGFNAETEDIILYLDLVQKLGSKAIWFDGRAPLVFPDGVLLWVLFKLTHNIIVTSILYSVIAAIAFLLAALALMKSRLRSWTTAMLLLALSTLYIFADHQLIWGIKIFIFFARWHSSAVSFGLGLVWVTRHLIFEITNVRERRFQGLLALLIVWTLALSTSDRILYSYALVPIIVTTAIIALRTPYRGACFAVITSLISCIIFTNLFIHYLPHTNFIPTENKDTAMHVSWGMVRQSFHKIPAIKDYLYENTTLLARLFFLFSLSIGIGIFAQWLRHIGSAGWRGLSETRTQDDQAVAKLEDEFSLVFVAIATIGCVIAPMIFGGLILQIVEPFYILLFPILPILFLPLAAQYAFQHLLKRKWPKLTPILASLFCLFLTWQGVRDGIRVGQNIDFSRPLYVQNFHFSEDHFAFYQILYTIFGHRHVNGLIPYHLQSLPDLLSDGKYHISYVRWFGVPYINNIAPAFFLDDKSGVWQERLYDFVLAGYSETPSPGDKPEDYKMTYKEVVARYGQPKKVIPIGENSPIGDKVAAMVDSHYKFQPSAKILIYDPPINPGLGRILCEEALSEYRRWGCLLPDTDPAIKHIHDVYHGLGIDDLDRIPDNIRILTAGMQAYGFDNGVTTPPGALGFRTNSGRHKGILASGSVLHMKPGNYCVRWSVSLSGSNNHNPQASMRVVEPASGYTVSQTMDLKSNSVPQADKLCFDNKDKRATYEFYSEFAGIDGRLDFNGATLETESGQGF